MSEDPPANNDEPSDQEAESSSSDAEPFMVVSRARRSNAGMGMAKLLAQEEIDGEDEQLQEIFAEDEEDEEFGGAQAEAPDDVSLGSSEDEEEGAEDQGEKELRKEERESKKRKKTDTGLVAMYQKTQQKAQRPRKKVKFDPHAVIEPSPANAVPRPRKKSERESWLPTQADAPLRASRRTLAVENRARTHESLRRQDKHREKTIAQMRAAADRAEKEKPKPMTQEERLAEALRIEEKNKSSLNKWEETERKRMADQKAKLDALKNKTIEGPMIRHYSGPAIWYQNRLKHVGKGVTVEEIEEAAKPDAVKPVAATQDSENVVQKPGAETPVPTALPQPTDTNLVPNLEDHPLAGIHFWASQAQPSEAPANPLAVSEPVPSIDPHSVAPSLPPPSPQEDMPIVQTQATTKNNHTHISDSSLTPHATLAARTLIHLANFPPESEIFSSNKSKDTIIRLLLDWKPHHHHSNTSTTKQPTVLPTPKPGAKAIDSSCVITGKRAKYKDPASGLAYYDLASYRAVKALAKGEGRWSVLLGAFVGGGIVAKGVPEGFASRVWR